MRVLSKREMRQFELTYEFLNHYVGSAYTHNRGKATVFDLRYDDTPAPTELINFCNTMDRVNSIPELNMQFGLISSLMKISILFNETSKAHKDVVMNRLIKYCFNKKVQPSALRVPMTQKTTFDVVLREEPTITSFDGDGNA